MRGSDEITYVDLSCWAGEFDAACKFIACVAYPESHRKRDKAIEAMHAVMFRIAKAYKVRCDTQAYRDAMTLPARDMGSRMRMLEKRLWLRIEAAAIFGALLRKTRPNLTSEPYSLNSFANTHRVGAARFKHEAWRHEVMHLAFALRQVGYAWKDPAPFGIVRLLANPHKWIGGAIDSAEKWASWRAYSTAFPPSLRKFGGAKLVRLVRSTVRFSQPPV